MEENGKLVQFIFNENKEVITEETNGNITRLIRTSDLWARKSEPEKTWYHYASDEQGSIVFITGKNGEVKNRYTYDAFGNTIEAEKNPEPLPIHRPAARPNNPAILPGGKIL